MKRARGALMTALEERLPAGIRVHAFSRRGGGIILSGLLSGLIASVALLVVMTIGALLRGEGFFLPVQLIASMAFGPVAAHGSPSTSVVVTGLMLHGLLGSTFGLIFGQFADALRPLTYRGLLVGGIAYGLALFLVMFVWVVPALAPLLAEQSWLATGLGHIAFGATLVVFKPISERLEAEDVAPRPLPMV
jgi:hypothetical protein